MSLPTYGTPCAPFIPARILDRLLVVETTPGVFCWLWQGGTTHDGYGLARHPDTERVQLVHRMVWGMAGRTIPRGYQTDHACHDPRACPRGSCVHRACANPWHLDLVTPAQNAHPHRRHPAPREKASTP